ncbi:MAG: 4-(cytidine 5'-diphospho)-2-C-methyl-D-erythritol kinase [Alphaproteobacteria bacterium]
MELNKLTFKSKAKINLFLHVTGKYDNGYHKLESLVCFADDVYDIIEATNAEDITLEINGEFTKNLSVENNIILKAANLLKGERELGAKILLTKNLPIASGIGGGSSNAATIIKILSILWNIEINNQFMSKLSMLGADVPCCYYGKSTYFSGIGEILSPLINFPSCYIVLVNPKKSVHTANIFQELNSQFSFAQYDYPLNFSNLSNLISFLEERGNDLQQVSTALLPEINNIIEIVKSQPNCLLARMSGSGATCFGLFATELEAKNAYLFIKEKFDWWVNYSMVS